MKNLLYSHWLCVAPFIPNKFKALSGMKYLFLTTWLLLPCQGLQIRRLINSLMYVVKDYRWFPPKCTLVFRVFIQKTYRVCFNRVALVEMVLPDPKVEKAKG
jgi:hypothetical protein